VDQREWDGAFAGTEPAWTAEANRFVAEELAGPPAGRAPGLGTGEGRNGGGERTAIDTVVRAQRR